MGTLLQGTPIYICRILKNSLAQRLVYATGKQRGVPMNNSDYYNPTRIIFGKDRLRELDEGGSRTSTAIRKMIESTTPSSERWRSSRS